MSTRCQIVFSVNKQDSILKPEVILYRHSNGYPGDGKEYGVLSCIVPFLRKFKIQRGLDDIEYCSAWLMHYLIDEYIKMMKKTHKTRTRKEQNEMKRHWQYLGHGISDQYQGDIAYVYRIYPNTLEVYEIVKSAQDLKNWPDNPYREDNFKLIQTIDLG